VIGPPNSQKKKKKAQRTQLPPAPPRHQLSNLCGCDTHLREHADGARHAKQHGVEGGLLDAVVLQQHAAVRVDVGPWVLDLRRGFEVRSSPSSHVRQTPGLLDFLLLELLLPALPTRTTACSQRTPMHTPFQEHGRLAWRAPLLLKFEGLGRHPPCRS